MCSRKQNPQAAVSLLIVSPLHMCPVPHNMHTQHTHHCAEPLPLLRPSRHVTGDASRKRQEAHYSSSTRTFSRSFVVGPLNDCCNISAGLADGLSWATFALARTDVRLSNPLRPGRKKLREDKACSPLPPPRPTLPPSYQLPFSSAFFPLVWFDQF